MAATTTATTTMAAAASKVENPKNPTDLNLTPPSTEDALTTAQSPSSGGEGDEAKVISGAVAVKTTDVDGGGAATDIQKKMKRAERFGVAVHLSEKEKRNSRAERFGTGPTGSSPNGLDSSKQSEEVKRKARAERFGIVQSVAADEDVKKKARLARFASPSVTDSAEEEKKKARALRFSQPGSSLKANGKGDTEVKTMIGDKAGGDT